MKVTSDMTSGDLIRLDQSRYALHWLPIRSGRITGRSCYGSWY